MQMISNLSLSLSLSLSRPRPPCASGGNEMRRRRYALVSRPTFISDQIDLPPPPPPHPQSSLKIQVGSLTLSRPHLVSRPESQHPRSFFFGVRFQIVRSIRPVVERSLGAASAFFFCFVLFCFCFVFFNFLSSTPRNP